MIKMLGNLFSLALVAVFIYLFVAHGDSTARVINAFGGQVNTSFKTLQGR